MPSIGARELLRLRLRASARRLRGGSLGAALVGAVVLAAAAAAASSLARLAGADLAAYGDPEALARTVRQRAFLLGVGQALVMGYTTFEALFRPRDAPFVALLPVSGRGRWAELQARAALLHLPLLLPAGGYAAGLLAGGAGAAALHVGLVAGVGWLVTLPICARVHLLAGGSLLAASSGGDGGSGWASETPLRRYLAGGVVPGEAAWLLYGPALAFAAAAVIVLGLDQGLRASAPLGAAEAGLTLAGAVVAGVLLTRNGLREADRILPAVVACFAEVDVPPPYREAGGVAPAPGERLARLLPRGARPVFRRELRQLRRRHRLDRLLVGVYAIVVLRAGLIHEGPGAPLAWLLSALALAAGVVLVSPFRLRGPELDARWLRRGWPIGRASEWTGSLAASALHPILALVATGAAAALAGGPTAAARVLVAGLPIVAGLVVGPQWLAERSPPDRVALAAWGWRAAVVVAVLGLRSVVPGVAAGGAG